MKKIVTITLASLVFAAAAFAALGDVISSFNLPSACGIGNALAWDGAYLWVCSYQGSFFFRLNTNGSIISSFQIVPSYYEYFGGATFDGEYLWCSSYDDRWDELGFTRYSTAGSRVSGFYFHTYFPWQCLAWDGNYLWSANRKVTTTGSILGSFPEPFYFSDPGWDGHYLWAAGPSRSVYQISTAGSVMASFPSPGPSRGGAAFDGLYLWLVSGGNEPPNRWVYQLDIGVEGTDPASFGKIKALYR